MIRFIVTNLTNFFDEMKNWAKLRLKQVTPAFIERNYVSNIFQKQYFKKRVFEQSFGLSM